MELATALARYGHALGRWQAAWRFASLELRQTVALAHISAAWDVFRRDAGPGVVGPAHYPSIASVSLLSTNDPRRDSVLLWLADHGTPAISEAAGLVADMVSATKRFGAEQQNLLQVARDALEFSGSPGPIARLLPRDHADGEGPLAPLCVLAGAVDQLRGDPAYLEASGAEVRHRFPEGAVSHYVPAEPGATWALNLALLSRVTLRLGSPACPGLVSRQLFRTLESDELAVALVEGDATALEAGYTLFGQIEPDLVKGDEVLAGMSRNSRARTTWRLIVALGGISRAQLARGLNLSRAGADIQAHALSKAGLVTLEPGGRIVRQSHQTRDRVYQAAGGDGVSTGVFADFDASMAEIDRLLARTAGPG